MLSIRDARPSDAPFLAMIVMAGMHFYDFETEIPAQREIYAGSIVAYSEMSYRPFPSEPSGSQWTILTERSGRKI